LGSRGYLSKVGSSRMRSSGTIFRVKMGHLLGQAGSCRLGRGQKCADLWFPRIACMRHPECDLQGPNKRQTPLDTAALATSKLCDGASYESSPLAEPLLGHTPKIHATNTSSSTVNRLQLSRCHNTPLTPLEAMLIYMRCRPSTSERPGSCRRHHSHTACRTSLRTACLGHNTSRMDIS